MSRSERRDRLENDMRVAMGALFVEMDNLRAEVERVTRERDEALAEVERLKNLVLDVWEDPKASELGAGVYRTLLDVHTQEWNETFAALPTPEEADRAE